MPLTAKGQEVLEAMKTKFGDKGEQLFYAAKNTGTVSGYDAKVTGMLHDGWATGAFGTQGGSFTDIAAFLQLLGDTDAPNDGILLYDAIPLDDDAKVRLTDDGFLTANPRIARTGIQLYRGSECGMPDRDVVRVYRPEEEVFKSDAIKSYAHRPVTIDHPSVPVNASNWRDYAVGQSGGDVLRDGNAVRVPLVLMDQSAVKAYKDGKRQLSVGYTCDIEATAGIIDGEHYDAIQRNIRANHIAVVTTARGGPTLVIGDNNGDTDMNAPNLKTLTVDGISCQMTDTAAEIVQRALAQANQRVTDATTAATKATTDAATQATKDATTIATLTTQVTTKDAEITTLKSELEKAKVTPAMLDGFVKERGDVIVIAKHMLGADAAKLVVDGKSVGEIRKQVVDAKVGAAAKDWSDEQVRVSFDTMAAGVDKSKLQNGTLDTRAFSQPHNNGFQTGDAGQDARDKAHNDYTKSLGDAWMNPQGGKAA